MTYKVFGQLQPCHIQLDIRLRIDILVLLELLCTNVMDMFFYPAHHHPCSVKSTAVFICGTISPCCLPSLPHQPVSL